MARCHVTARARVCVCWRLDPPHFTCRPRPIYQRQPIQSVTMPCCADGDPMPLITWRKVNTTSVSNDADGPARRCPVYHRAVHGAGCGVRSTGNDRARQLARSAVVAGCCQQPTDPLSLCIRPHSTTPTPTSSPTSLGGSSRGCQRVGRLPRSAYHRNNFRKSRVLRVGKNPREDVVVGVNVVECTLVDSSCAVAKLSKSISAMFQK